MALVAGAFSPARARTHRTLQSWGARSSQRAYTYRLSSSSIVLSRPPPRRPVTRRNEDAPEERLGRGSALFFSRIRLGDKIRVKARRAPVPPRSRSIRNFDSRQRRQLSVSLGQVDARVFSVLTYIPRESCFFFSSSNAPRASLCRAYTGPRARGNAARRSCRLGFLMHVVSGERADYRMLRGLRGPLPPLRPLNVRAECSCLKIKVPGLFRFALLLIR